MTLTSIRRLAKSPSAMMTASVLLVAGGGYLFLMLAGGLSDKKEAAAMASMYVLVNLIGQGVFAGLEQETSRSLSRAAAVGDDTGPVMRRAVRHTAALLAVCCVFVAAASPILVAGPLHKQWVLIPTVLVGTVSYALSYLVRGLLGGQQLFGGYSATLVAEGLSRIVPCLAIVAVGAGSALIYCAVYSCGLFFSAGIGWYFWLRPRLARQRAEAAGTAASATHADAAVHADAKADANANADTDTHESGLRAWYSAGLLFLVGAALLTQLVANLPALGASSRLGAHPATATAFVQAATLARIPLLLVGPVTALLLPRLTAAGAIGDMRAVRTTVRTGSIAMLALGSLAGAGLGVLGPWVLKTFFHASGISALSLVLMAIGTAGLMTVGVLQPTLIGLARQRQVPIAWVIGAVAMGVAVVWPGDPVAAAVAASLVGPAGVVLAMAFSLRGLRNARFAGAEDALAADPADPAGAPTPAAEAQAAGRV
ncbi:O-antigen/teichoic acid export membrane protein [Catenulispora sp. GP43]|uniref:lipopolysaccharide biosynthesis protein n=1 Tax=Catenulispora sp. GP43 TaxID=3156263 RepID=UPI0035155DEF